MKLSDILAENAHPTDVSDYTSFWNSLNSTIERQKENPVNIIIKKIFWQKFCKSCRSRFRRCRKSSKKFFV